MNYNLLVMFIGILLFLKVLVTYFTKHISFSDQWAYIFVGFFLMVFALMDLLPRDRDKHL